MMNPYTFPGIPKMETDETTVKTVVARVMGVDPHTLAGRTRKRDVVTARQMFCYIMRQNTDLPLWKIALMLRRDHSSVVHSVQTMQGLLEVDQYVKDKLEQVKRELK